MIATPLAPPNRECSSKLPRSGDPSNCHCHATSPVAMLATTVVAANVRFQYAASARAAALGPGLHTATHSKTIAAVVRAIGKCTSTTCCACFARIALLRSKGLATTSSHYLTTILPVIRGCIEQ